MQDAVQTRLMRENDMMKYLSCSRSYLRKWGAEIGAVRRIGARCIRYDKSIIDAAIEQQSK